MAEKCTNTSSPVERWMNPYPFAPLNHFTVPFSLTKNSFRLIAKNYSSVALLFALAWKRGHPLKGTVRTWVASPHAEKPRQQKRLPCVPSTVARDEIRWSRENEGAIFALPTRKRQTHLLANPVRLTKHQIIAGRFRLARAKLRTHLSMTPSRLQFINRSYAMSKRRKIARFALYSERAHPDPRTSHFVSGNRTRRSGVAAAFLRLLSSGHRRLPRLRRPRLQLAAARHLWPDANRPAVNADRAYRHAPAGIPGRRVSV